MARGISWQAKLGRAVTVMLLAVILSSWVAVILLRWLNPPLSAFMIEAQCAAWAQGDVAYAPHHQWVALEHISPNLPLAVVASEDQKFTEHRGFDVEAIEKAYALNRHSHRVRGGSTISQQVAKNLFLWSGRSYSRKGLEAYFTVLLETFWPKRRILEMYLNIAQFGTGIYGAEAAARTFFHEDAAHLRRSEAAVLAAVLPNPERFRAAAPSRYVMQRRDWILEQMQALGGSEMLDEIDAYPRSSH